MEAIRRPLEGPGRGTGRGPHAEQAGLCRGSCPCCWAGEGRGDVPGSCLHPLLAWERVSLSPSRYRGRGLTSLGTSSACELPARTIPKLVSHPVQLTSPLAQHHLQGVLLGQCQRYPLYWHHCFVQPQYG